jgi:DNA-binding SARP family transcriptional activator
MAFGAALDLYQDEVLADDGPAEWTARARERYRTDAVDAAQSLAEIELDEGRAAAAATAADRGLRLDRYRDQLWRLRLAASHLAGDLADCARIRLAYQEVLVELGVDIDTALNTPLRSA